MFPTWSPELASLQQPHLTSSSAAPTASKAPGHPVTTPSHPHPLGRSLENSACFCRICPLEGQTARQQGATRPQFSPKVKQLVSVRHVSALMIRGL